MCDTAQVRVVSSLVSVMVNGPLGTKQELIGKDSGMMVDIALSRLNRLMSSSWRSSRLLCTTYFLHPRRPHYSDQISITLEHCAQPLCRQNWLVNAWRGPAAEVGNPGRTYCSFVGYISPGY